MSEIIQYRDMTAEQMLDWGVNESAARKADLAADRSQEGLSAAQLKAESRRKLIGASRSAAASMVIDAQRQKRRDDFAKSV